MFEQRRVGELLDADRGELVELAEMTGQPVEPLTDTAAGGLPVAKRKQQRAQAQLVILAHVDMAVDQRVAGARCSDAHFVAVQVVQIADELELRSRVERRRRAGTVFGGSAAAAPHPDGSGNRVGPFDFWRGFGGKRGDGAGLENADPMAIDGPLDVLRAIERGLDPQGQLCEGGELRGSQASRRTAGVAEIDAIDFVVVRSDFAGYEGIA